MTTQRPNLFEYGHKELSQDAMICWLLKWADKCYAEMCPDIHQAGQNFARALFRKHDHSGPDDICTVELGQQVKGIDVLAWINGKYALLIEDKTDSNKHSGQLERYHALVRSGDIWLGDEEKKQVKPSEGCLFPIFLKTGNMSRADKTNVEALKLDPHYKVFGRGDFLGTLKKCSRGVSEVMDDFSDHLQELEKDSESWKGTPLERWSWRAWEGFYLYLEEKIDPRSEKNMNWGYVPKGDFQGLWWDCGGGAYLQAEEEKLCFKIYVKDPDMQRECRQHWHERIMQAGESLGLQKPSRFGSGTHMTVAVLEDWRSPDGEGHLDLEKTVGVLEQAEHVVKTA